MQITTLGRIIRVWPRRVLTSVLAGILVLALTPRLPVAGQQVAQEKTAAESETPEQLQNQSIPDRISDHNPITVDLPLNEPPSNN